MGCRAAAASDGADAPAGAGEAVASATAECAGGLIDARNAAANVAAARKRRERFGRGRTNDEIRMGEGPCEKESQKSVLFDRRTESGSESQPDVLLSRERLSAAGPTRRAESIRQMEIAGGQFSGKVAESGQIAPTRTKNPPRDCSRGGLADSRESEFATAIASVAPRRSCASWDPPHFFSTGNQAYLRINGRGP